MSERRIIKLAEEVDELHRENAQLREALRDSERLSRALDADNQRLREAIRRHLDSKTFAGKLSHDCHDLRAALGDTPDEPKNNPEMVPTYYGTGWRKRRGPNDYGDQPMTGDTPDE